MVLDRLNHDEVLSLWGAHLHSSRLADRRMRNVAVASDLVRGVNHHHTLAKFRGEDACRLAEHGGLTDTRSPHDQNRSARFDMVAQDLNGAEHRATDTAGEANDSIRSIANRRDAVQRSFDSSAVVTTKVADACDHPVQVFVGDLAFE